MTMQAFLVALQFLTRLPVRLGTLPDDKTIGFSLIFYPLVGIILGALLLGFAELLSGASSLIAAALLVTAWVLLTGGLHLDGLADSADAWIGGMGSREKSLTIMKDPNCGPAGVVSIVLILLLKFAALHTLLDTGDCIAILLAATLGRTLLPLLFLTTPYVRANGLGSPLANHLPRQACWVSIAVVPALMLLLPDAHHLIVLPVVLMIFLLLQHLMLQRIGGTTGDTAGALVEIGEAAVLLTAVMIQGEF